MGATMCCCSQQEQQAQARPQLVDVFAVSTEKNPFVDDEEDDGKETDRCMESGSTKTGEASEAADDAEDLLDDNRGSALPGLADSFPSEASEIDMNSQDVFEVEISKANGKRFGFYVSYQPGARHLEVAKVLASGLIPEWNKENPNWIVEEGYHILAVNGTRIQPQAQGTRHAAMVQACKETKLCFVFRRVEPTS
mmetsp:Transcript_15613/g.36546  ORF Transcript_15613/g.36546 Transcript_15613/m.36546 type:complete len:195 (+) Transcript_15613:147-731(+)